MRPRRLLTLVLAALAVSLSATACTSSDEDSAPSPGPSPAAKAPDGDPRRIAMDSLPPTVTRQIHRLRGDLGDPGSRLSVYRWTRRAAQERLGAPSTGGGNGPIVFAAFEGDLRYRRARTLDPDKSVTGRFAFASYTAKGDQLDFGVFPEVPPGFAK